MAHMKPASSRAMATVTTLACLPFATSRRERLHRLTCAFQLMSWISLGCFSRRSCRCRLTLAGERYAQALSPRTRRAWGLPAVVIDPGWRRSPEEDSEGITPKNFMSALGVSKRVRSPISATRVTATVPCTPRKAWRASTTGVTRHDGTCAWSSWSRRWRRSLCSLTARTYSWKTSCWAGVGQTTSESHRRGAGRQLARPVERISCLRKKAVESKRGVLEIADGICTGPREIPEGFIFHFWDIHRGEIPRAREPGQLHGVPAIGFDPIPRFFGDQRGRDDPAIIAFCSCRDR